MFKSYLKIAVRAALREPVGALVSILGLATGFTAFILAYAFLLYEQSYDDFFAQAPDIVTLYVIPPAGSSIKMARLASYYPGLAAEAPERFSEVEAATALYRADHEIRTDELNFHQMISFADASFFRIFDLKFLAGGAGGWKERANAAVLSRSMAHRLFGTIDAVGNSFKIGDDEILTVIGVFGDLPQNSHFVEGYGARSPMDIIAAAPVFDRLHPTQQAGTWRSGNAYVYLLLGEGAGRETLARDITELTLQRIDQSRSNLFGKAEIVPLTDIHALKTRSRNWVSPRLAAFVGGLVLLVAVVNAVSLNTAQLAGRRREIAIRQIVGARRRDIFLQFLAERLMVSFLALLIAVGMAELLLPWVNAVTEYPIDPSAMLQSGPAIMLAALAALVALASIIYPAMQISGLSPRRRADHAARLARASSRLRSSLAVFQFTIVTALVIVTIVAIRQISYLADAVPDFNASRVVTISGIKSAESKRTLPVVEKAIEALPGVEMTSLSSTFPYNNHIMLSMFQHENGPGEPLAMEMVGVDEKFLALYGLTLAAGQNFDPAVDRNRDSRAETAETADAEPYYQKVMIDDLAWRQLGFQSAGAALDQTFVNRASSGSLRYRIIGVLDKIRLNRHDMRAYPVVFMYGGLGSGILNIRFSAPGHVSLERINAVLEEYLPFEQPLVEPLAETIDASLQAPRQMLTAFLSVAFVAVILATAGLFASAALLATSKRKEMCIRKVLGARTGQLVYFLLWRFTRPIGISVALGLPIGLWLAGQYLERYPDRIAPGAQEGLEAAAITLIIALLTVLVHAIRTSRTHPAEVLRVE